MPRSAVPRAPGYFRPEEVRGYALEQFRLRLLMIPVPTRRIAMLCEGKVLQGTASKHRAPSARKMRTMQRLKRYVEKYHWSQHPCAIGPGEFDHDFRVVSESYGDPEVINGTATDFWRECRTCGKTAEATYADLYDDEDYF